jgi:hypothetical protein
MNAAHDLPRVLEVYGSRSATSVRGQRYSVLAPPETPEPSSLHFARPRIPLDFRPINLSCLRASAPTFPPHRVTGWRMVESRSSDRRCVTRHAKARAAAPGCDCPTLSTPSPRAPGADRPKTFLSLPGAGERVGERGERRSTSTTARFADRIVALRIERSPTPRAPRPSHRAFLGTRVRLTPGSPARRCRRRR